MEEIVGRKRSGVTVSIILIIICILWTLPTLGLLLTSFRDEFIAKKTGWWTVFKDPGGLTVTNYKQVLIGKDYTYVNAEGIEVTARSQNLLLAFDNHITGSEIILYLHAQIFFRKILYMSHGSFHQKIFSQEFKRKYPIVGLSL